MSYYYSRKAYKEKCKIYSNRWKGYRVDQCTILMFEAFLEAAPNLLLQMYALEVNGWADDAWELGE